MKRSNVVIDSAIFRCYDIRGIVPQQIDIDVAYQIGNAFGRHLKSCGIDVVTVGRDSRLSSDSLHQGLIQGLRAAAVNIIDIGICTTPLLSYACLKSSGVMLTASHNPANYNGFKFIVNGEIFDQLMLLRELTCQPMCATTPTGSYRQESMRARYTDEIVNNISLNKSHRIIVDGSNSPAGLLALSIFQRLGCSVGALNMQLDGNFPGHSPDTGDASNYRQLCREVVARGADFGFMFDGDGDRCVAVSHEGQIIWPDQMLTLMSQDLLRQQPNATIVYDVKCSNQVAIGIERQGGTAIMSKTGRSNIYQKLIDEGAQLAGEYSGHFFFAHRWFTTDDAIYAACRLIEGCEQSGRSLQQRVALLATSLSTPEIVIAVDDKHKYSLVKALIESLEQQITNHSITAAQVTTLDGLRIDYSDGWGLVRASNTMPALTLRFEAQTKNKLRDMIQFFTSNLYTVARQHNIDIDNPDNLTINL